MVKWKKLKSEIEGESLGMNVVDHVPVRTNEIAMVMMGDTEKIKKRQSSVFDLLIKTTPLHQKRDGRRKNKGRRTGTVHYPLLMDVRCGSGHWLFTSSFTRSVGRVFMIPSFSYYSIHILFVLRMCAFSRRPWDWHLQEGLKDKAVFSSY